jgi:hypothetical protein
MKSVRFKGKVSPDGRIVLPPEIAGELPFDIPLQVVVLWNGADDDTAWRASAMERFAAAYAAEDSVYEALIDES